MTVLIPLTREEWIKRALVQTMLDTGRFQVVPCINCDDTVCHGWRIETKPPAAEAQAEGK